MNRIRPLSIVLSWSVFLTIGLQLNPVHASENTTAWKAGVASVVITPEKPMWMGGYASRKKPSEGKVDDLFAKALVLEDAAGTQVAIVTTDLIGIPRRLRENLEVRVQEQFGLRPESFLINASHTHCGPEMREYRATMYGLGSERAAEIRTYVQQLENKLIELIGTALEDLKPAALSYSHARAGFAMNRRLKGEQGYRNHPNPDGPVDHDVPVLRVDNTDGTIRAILFGYACHNTTMSFYKFFGDYAGVAQELIESEHPECTALFLAGCGGDQNPYPRRKLEYAYHHGRALANAVETALQAKPRPVDAPLRLAMDYAALEFEKAPTRDELLKMKESSDKYRRARGSALLDELNSNGSINMKYPYPIQILQLGNDLTIIALAGETVVDYSIRFKNELPGAAVWVAGYSNDVFGYVPSLRVWKEGGYEAGNAMRYTLLPGRFSSTIESSIHAKTHELVKQVREREP